MIRSKLLTMRQYGVGRPLSLAVNAISIAMLDVNVKFCAQSDDDPSSLSSILVFFPSY